MFNLFKNRSLILAALSASNIAIAFILQIITFNIIGPGRETDALFLGLSVPTFILSITVTSLNNVLVPFFSGQDKYTVNKTASMLLSIFVGGSVLVALMLWISIDLWLPLLANGFDKNTYLLCKSLTEIQLIAIPFYILFSIQWSILNGKKKHVSSELSPAIINFITIPILIFLLPIYGVYTLAYAYSIKIILQNIIIFYFNRDLKITSFNRMQFIELWKKIKPVMLGSIYYKSEPVVDRSLLTNSLSGTLSLFFLAQQIISAFNQIITKSFVTPSVAVMSEAFKNKDHEKLVRVYKNTFKKIFFVLSLISIVFLVFGRQATDILLSLRDNDSDSSVLLFTLLYLLSGALIGNVAGSLASASFYAAGDTKTPSYMSMINYTIYIPLKIVTYIYFDITGLAIITSFYSLFNLVSLLFLYKYKIMRKL